MTVFVTADGSARSFRVLAHAGKLASALRMPLILAHVLEDGSEIEPTNEGGPWRVRLAGFLEQAGVHGNAVVAARAPGEGTADAILRLANETGARTIAMDSRGSGMVRHTLLGSMALRVVRGAPGGVLITGPGAASPRDTDRYRIVVTSDGSPACMSIVPALSSMLADSEGAVVRIHVPTFADRGDRVELEACAAEEKNFCALLPHGIEIQEVIETAPKFAFVVDPILRVAAESGASAIAMATHGHSALRHVVAGSTGLGVLQRSPLPVILARARVFND